MTCMNTTLAMISMLNPFENRVWLWGGIVYCRRSSTGLPYPAERRSPSAWLSPRTVRPPCFALGRLSPWTAAHSSARAWPSPRRNLTLVLQIHLVSHEDHGHALVPVDIWDMRMNQSVSITWQVQGEMWHFSINCSCFRTGFPNSFTAFIALVCNWSGKTDSPSPKLMSSVESTVVKTEQCFKRVTMATFTLRALVLNSDFFLRSDFFCIAVHIVVLNVANIRFTVWTDHGFWTDPHAQKNDTNRVPDFHNTKSTNCFSN